MCKICTLHAHHLVELNVESTVSKMEIAQREEGCFVNRPEVSTTRGDYQLPAHRRRKPIEKHPSQKQPEEGVIVPMGQINPDTLRNMVVEFVTREWSELTDGGIIAGEWRSGDGAD